MGDELKKDGDERSTWTLVLIFATRSQFEVVSIPGFTSEDAAVEQGNRAREGGQWGDVRIASYMTLRVW